MEINNTKADKIKDVKVIIMDGINKEQEYIANLLQNEPGKYLERVDEDYYLTLCKKCLFPWIVHQQGEEDHQIILNKKRIIVEEDLYNEVRETGLSNYQKL